MKVFSEKNSKDSIHLIVGNNNNITLFDDEIVKFINLEYLDIMEQNRNNLQQQ